MKKKSFFLLFSFFVFLSCHLSGQEESANQLNEIYVDICNQPSKIREQLPLLSWYAKECASVIAIDSKEDDATWALLQGLSESYANPRSYLRIGGEDVSIESLNLAKSLAEKHLIQFSFWKVKDLFIQIEPTDLLFLDISRTYCHLMYELETFSSQVSKYICIPGTSGPHAHADGEGYYSNYSEFDTSYDRIKSTYNHSKKGLWQAILDFLSRHPEWVLLEQDEENEGMAVLQRANDMSVPPLFSSALVDEYLKSKMILCTGPALGRYDMLKKSTESDLSIVPFKKIYVVTNEPAIAGISFCGKKPDVCHLIPNRGKHVDCVNCIVHSMKYAVNDPDVLDDDIILFKHESVFINDLQLMKRAIQKIAHEGYNMVLRNMAQWSGTAATDAFYIKVSAIRDIVKDYPDIGYLPPHAWFCESYFHQMIVHRISKIFGIYYDHSNGDFTEIGFYHYPSQQERHRHYWDRRNRNRLFDLPSYFQ